MSATIERVQWDLLLILTAPPHTNDTLTAVLRLVQAVLDQGRTARIWACGYNTMLTQVALGDTKPVDLRRPEQVHPSAAGVIGHLLTKYERRMSWLVCTACAAKRGARGHIPPVRLRSATRLAATIAAGRSMRAMVAEGVTVYVDEDSLRLYGLTPPALIPGVVCLDTTELAGRWGEYDGVWFL